MKAHTNWSYHPYKPFFYDCGDIYICRIAPSETEITFDWLADTSTNCLYSIYYRLRNSHSFTPAGSTKNLSYTISGLKSGNDYEFYVEANGKKSRVRLAKCGKSFGTTVNYLHPDDEAYSFSGRYLCSPSLVRHPDGFLLASMDLYGSEMPQNLTLIYRSDDNGRSWSYISELFPCFWGKMFIHNGELYMLACSTEYGDLLIGKSTDGGKTFSEPSVLLRGGGGKKGEPGVHKNPQPIVKYTGRLWNTLEWGSWEKGYHAAMVMSADTSSDIMNPKSWQFSYPQKYNPNWSGVPKGASSGNIEGCLVVHENTLYNVMRYDMSKLSPNFGLAIAYTADAKNPENPLEFSHCIRFPGNHAKFEIKYDEKTKKYYSIVSRILNSESALNRNLLSLIASADMENWYVVKDIIDKTDCDPQKIGFQYVDFIIENGKILYLCRTAINGANSYHDSNYSSFGEIII